MKSVNEGLICTNDNCVGCNKCIGVCSCFGATIATESSEGTNIIKADSSKCIACGACFDACEHHAREFVDDTDKFFEDLKNGEKISIMVAPAFIANYPNEYKDILGKLKSLGVNRILSVAFGANITTWAYINYIKKYNFRGGISQPCPAAFHMIESKRPDLILLDYEMPVCNGAQFLQMLHSERHTENIPVIFLTSKDDAETVKSVIALKPQGYLLKNQTKDQTLKAIAEFFVREKLK